MSLRDESCSSETSGLSAMVKRTKVVPREAFNPLYFKSCDNFSILLVPYLNRLIMDYQDQYGCCLMLPSLDYLAKVFRLPKTEIRAAFASLKTNGHDYMMNGDHGDITVWIKPGYPMAPHLSAGPTPA